MLRNLTVKRVVLVLVVVSVFGLASAAGGALVATYMMGKDPFSNLTSEALASAAQADLARELQCFRGDPLGCPQDIFFRLASLVDYKCYRIEKGDDLNQVVDLLHWNPSLRGRKETVVVREAQLLCTPVTKGGFRSR